METSDMYFFSVLHVPFFYKHSINNAQTRNKYVGRKYGSKLSWAVMGRNGCGPN